MIARWKALGWLLAAVLLTSGVAVPAWAKDDGKLEQDIRSVLDRQAQAWNRGDIAAFMQAYKDSADTTFIGKRIQHGYRMIEDRYKTAYPNKDTMGTLKYWDLKVQPLGGKYAVVTGHFHLDRAEHKDDASADDGVFSLIFEKTADGWKVILDHTST